MSRDNGKGGVVERELGIHKRRKMVDGPQALVMATGVSQPAGQVSPEIDQMVWDRDSPT